MLRPHIVIIGAGFGGVYAAKQLASRVKKGELDLTIVSRTNYFLFTPLLHEVATGGLSPRSVAEPLREIFVDTDIRMVQGNVGSIDMAAQTVLVDSGSSEHISLNYDYLIIATGAETNYYGIPGAAELSLPLKNLTDAVMIRGRVIDAFERAVLTDDEGRRRELLSFAIVGGGPTGVELAAELAEFAHGIAERYYNGGYCKPEEVTVTLVNSGKELLGPFSPALRKAAEDRLIHNGVIVMNEVAVTKVTSSGLETVGGKAITAATVIWAAGVMAVAPPFVGEAPASSGGRLAVDGSFRLAGSDRVFAMGDVAAYVDTDDMQKDPSKPRSLPMLAQVAVAQARAVTRNILAAIRGETLGDFHYRSKGSFVSVGQWFAVGDVFHRKLTGRLAWWIWRTVYLFKFASWRKRIVIASEWAFELVLPRDITELG